MLRLYINGFNTKCILLAHRLVIIIIIVIIIIDIGTVIELSRAEYT